MDKIDHHIKKAYDETQFEFSEQAWSSFKSGYLDDNEPDTGLAWWKYAATMAAGLIIGGLLVWMLMRSPAVPGEEGGLVSSSTTSTSQTSSASPAEKEAGHEEMNEGATNQRSQEESQRVGGESIQIVGSANEEKTYSASKSTNQGAIVGSNRSQSILSNLVEIPESFYFDGAQLTIGDASSSNLGLKLREWPIWKGDDEARNDAAGKLMDLVEDDMQIAAYVEALPAKLSILTADRNLSAYGLDDIPIPVEARRGPWQWYTNGVASVGYTGSTLTAEYPTIQLEGGLEYATVSNWVLRGGIGIKSSNERQIRKESLQIQPQQNGVNTYALRTNSIQYAYGSFWVGRKLGNFGLLLGVQPALIVSGYGQIVHDSGDVFSDKINSQVATTGLSSVQLDWMAAIEGHISDSWKWQLRLNLPELSTEAIDNEAYNIDIRKDQFLLGIGFTKYIKP